MELPLLPVAASQAAGEVDKVFFTWLVLGSVTFCGIFAVIAYLGYKYRAGSRADRSPQALPAVPMELAWTFIPMAIFVAMFAWAAWLFYQNASPPANATEIYVVGKRWMWKVQHAGGQREINTLHVPLGQPIKLVMTSQDVIHSFFVPAFRLKQDVVPGRYATEWFTPTRLGEFHLFCSEYCGTDHAKMGGSVVVQTPAEHARWLARLAPANNLAAQGLEVYRRSGCSGCHSPRAMVDAPSLDGIYGQPQRLSTGGVAIADEAYLRDAILDPNKQVVAGYQPLMPSFQGQLSEQELAALIAYLAHPGAHPPSGADHDDRP